MYPEAESVIKLYLWRVATECVTLLWRLVVARIAICPAVRTPVSRSFKKTVCGGARRAPQVPVQCSGGVKQGEPASFKTGERCIRKKRVATGKHYKRAMLQVKKIVIKNPTQLLCSHFKPHQAGWGSPSPRRVSKLENLSSTCNPMLLWKMQAVSRKFIPVLAIQLCRIASLLKQGSLALLIRPTHGQHSAGADTECFHQYRDDLPEESSMR